MEETPELEARGPRQARDVMDQLPVNDYVSMSPRFITVQTAGELDNHALFSWYKSFINRSSLSELKTDHVDHRVLKLLYISA